MQKLGLVCIEAIGLFRRNSLPGATVLADWVLKWPYVDQNQIGWILRLIVQCAPETQEAHKVTMMMCSSGRAVAERENDCSDGGSENA